MNAIDVSRELLQFIDESPTAFHAISTIESELQKNGFTALKETENSPIALGGK